ncbi:MAG: preprotein translocase subunit SecE [Candidatus Omnitrophica bacterium]|nr:preprotein translocase subunit SecE [Candidatus Omnitrophota bacterium]
MVNFGKYVGQVKTEMKKVAWPSRQELISSTVVVLVSTFILALYIGVCDVLLSRFLNFLISGIIY